LIITFIAEGRKKEEGRRKKEEGRRKKEEGRRKARHGSHGYKDELLVGHESYRSWKTEESKCSNSNIFNLP
jgi:hypothetical protein